MSVSSAMEALHLIWTYYQFLLHLTECPLLKTDTFSIKSWFVIRREHSASGKEAGNRPTLSATLPLRCLPTWVMTTK